MNNPGISRVSTDFFIAAALLALFGAAALNNARPHGALQVTLAVLMGGAGMYVRSGTAEARVIGLAAAAVTVAVGCYVVIFGNDYAVGTIIAIFALARLWSAGKPVMVMPQAVPALPTQPMATFDAPHAYGNGAVPAQSAASPARSYEPPALTPFYPSATPAPIYPSATPAPLYPATEHVANPPASQRLPEDPA
jgi:hypothetical protein